MENQPSTLPIQTTPPVDTDVHENKDIAALGYVWILAIVVYASKKHSSFARFHARQGIVLFILSIVVWFVPVVNRFLELIVLALCVMGFLAAAQGHWKELPLIYPLSRGDWKGVRSSWRIIVQAIVDTWNHLRQMIRSDKSETPYGIAVQPAPKAQSKLTDSVSKQ